MILHYQYGSNAMIDWHNQYVELPIFGVIPLWQGVTILTMLDITQVFINMENILLSLTFKKCHSIGLFHIQYNKCTFIL